MDEAPRTVEPPLEFESYEFVILQVPADAPEIDDEAAALLQGQHLGHFANMRDAGHLKAAGPLREQPDQRLRGICIYQVGSVEEVRALAAQDPAVRAGQLEAVVMKWYTTKGAVTFNTSPAPAPE